MLDIAIEREQRDGYEFERFDLSGRGWESAALLIDPIERDAFGHKGFELKDLGESLQQPKTVLIVAKSGDQVVGFTYAVPYSFIKNEVTQVDRVDKGEKTAYVYDTAITKLHQGKKITPRMMERLLLELGSEGYEFLERDADVDSGYADQIQKAYGQRGMILQAGPDHDSNWGKQRFFRMKVPQLA